MNEIFERTDRLQRNEVWYRFYVLLLEQLDALLRFLSSNFSSYLGKTHKVPKIYLRSVKEDLRHKIRVLREKQVDIKDPQLKETTLIILNALDRFVNTERYSYKITYQCVQYRLKLVKKLGELNHWEMVDDPYLSALDQLLIYQNFNSKAYMDYLKMRFVQEVRLAGEEASPQIERLLDLRKRFRTLHYSPDESGFNPEYQDISTFFENFFEQEISYRQHLSEKQADTPDHNIPVSSKTKKASAPSKVQVALSSDQTALLLRAADEARILSARSMTEVFRTIIPNISTTARKELSFESVRIKSYNPEDRDKEIAIEALEKMIRKIRDY